MSDESIAELVSAFEAHDFGADTEFRVSEANERAIESK
jgi:hypothetical protein